MKVVILCNLLKTQTSKVNNFRITEIIFCKQVGEQKNIEFYIINLRCEETFKNRHRFYHFITVLLFNMSTQRKYCYLQISFFQTCWR
jgi:hypothetical protein